MAARPPARLQALQVADRHAGAIHENGLPRQERTSARLVYSCPRCGFRGGDPGDAFCAPVAGICRRPLRAGATPRTLVHTEVPGTVAEVLSDEGQFVAPGAPLLRLRNLELESAAALAGADLRNASARAVRPGMSYQNFGPAEHERRQSTVRQQARRRKSNISKLPAPSAALSPPPSYTICWAPT